MGKFIDLTGQRFGRLVVIKRAENNGKRTMWLCKCDCGNETIVDGGNLVKKNTISCGCRKKEIGAERFKDLTGRTFGELTALPYAMKPNDRGSYHWLCKCKCDGKLIVVDVVSLLGKHTQSCGCIHSPNLANKKFGKWVVISLSTKTDKKKHKYYLCKCKCGTERLVRSSHLMNGETNSCGCDCHQLKDLLGKKLGFLTVIEYIGEINGMRSYWLCKCECGNLIKIRSTHLCGSRSSRKTISCGCARHVGVSTRKYADAKQLRASRLLYEGRKFIEQHANNKAKGEVM